MQVIHDKKPIADDRQPFSRATENMKTELTLFLDRSQCTYFVYQTEWPRQPGLLFSMSVACPAVRAMAPVNKYKMT